MGINVSTLDQSQKNTDGVMVWNYVNGSPMLFNTSGNGGVMIWNNAGRFDIYKSFTMDSGILVAQIAANGFGGTDRPMLLSGALYENRYVLFGCEYQATAGGSFVYSLKKVDLNTGNITTLLDNYTTPVTGIMVDGNRIVVSVGNSLIKMDIDGGNVITYNSPNIMPTLVGKCNGYYYITTTRNATFSTMNIEVIAENSFSSSEIVETNITMIQTNAIPRITENGYLCFTAVHYKASSVSGDYTTASGRTATMRASAAGVSRDWDFEKICRIRCY